MRAYTPGGRFDSDFELDSIIDLFKNESLRDKIFNSKITTYEEIN